MPNDVPLVNASDAELATLVEENAFAFFRSMATVLPESHLEERSDLCRHLTFPHNPMFKGVWRTRLAPGDVDHAIEDSVAWFRERNAPFMFWWTGPGTVPNDMGERLTRHGFLSMEEQQKELAQGIHQTATGAPCMVANLAAMNETVLDNLPDDFTLEKVTDELDLYDFKRVFVEVYGIPDWAGQAWVDATLRGGIGRTPWTMYVGRLGGEPIATTMLFNGAGVASVYAVGAVPSVRGKGIGGAVTLMPLLEARAMGYHHAVLFSTEMGIHAYERIGFRQTDARINRYLWRNDDYSE